MRRAALIRLFWTELERGRVSSRAMTGGSFKVRPYEVSVAASTLLAGVAVALAPRVLAVGLAVAFCVYLLTKPVGRLAWFILGAMLVFQSGAGLTPSKIGYLAGVITSVILTLPGLRVTLTTPWGARFRPALMGALVLAGWVGAITSVQSLAVRGVTVEAWGRDTLTYLLISAAVVLGVDAASSVTVRQARLITVVVGALAAVGFAIAWLARREATGLPADQNLLASMVALTVPLALALTLGLVGGGVRLRWLLYAVGLVSAVLVTGTRTGAVLAVVVLGLVGVRRKYRVPALKALSGILLAGAAVAVSLVLLGDRLTAQGFRESRWNAALRVITDGYQQDRSGVIRARAYEYAHAIFEEYPLLGQGPGVLFPNPNPGSEAANFTLDTPLVYLAKFGIIGTAVLMVVLWLIISSCVRRHGGPWLPEMTVARGATAVWVAILPFGPPTEDKGFALSVALLVLLVGTASRHATPPAVTLRPRRPVEVSTG